MTTDPANWYARAAAFLGGFPDDYLGFDTETQGLNPESPSTLPVQIGFTLVLGRRIESWGDYVVDWTKGRSPVDPGWFFRSLEEVASRMAAAGKAYHVTPALVRSRGVPPEEALEAFGALVGDALAGGLQLVAHNGYGYDRPLIEGCSRRAGRPIAVDPERLVDTGLLEKCRRLGWDPPHPGESPRRHWYNKIRDRRARVKWSLDVACEEEYGLSRRHGLGTAAAHSAGFDCVCSHHLLEAMRERADAGAAAAR